jgi:hypothetical protein
MRSIRTTIAAGLAFLAMGGVAAYAVGTSGAGGDDTATTAPPTTTTSTEARPATDDTPAATTTQTTPAPARGDADKRRGHDRGDADAPPARAAQPSDDNVKATPDDRGADDTSVRTGKPDGNAGAATDDHGRNRRSGDDDAVDNSGPGNAQDRVDNSGPGNAQDRAGDSGSGTAGASADDNPTAGEDHGGHGGGGDDSRQGGGGDNGGDDD